MKRKRGEKLALKCACLETKHIIPAHNPLNKMSHMALLNLKEDSEVKLTTSLEKEEQIQIDKRQ